MSKSPEQQNTTLLSWWVRLCRWLWAQRGFIWGTLVTGILISIIATWLTTQTSIFTGTPLGMALLWIYDNRPLAGFIGLSLFLLTVLVGVVSHQPVIPTPSGAILAQKSRADLIHRLGNEYRRQMAASLQSATMVALKLQTRTDVGLSSLSSVPWPMDVPGDYSSPPPASIVQAYDDSGGGLLILGDPGVGKSTLLRELASELLTRAKNDATKPIPVIVNLSTWAIKKPLLTIWMVDRLWEMYNIPPALSQACIEQDQLLFLLDGLDEVKPSAQTNCIEAINSYLGKQEQIIPIVVCSGKQVFRQQEERLRLPVAVEVRPLTPEQVDGYLKDVGEPVEAVRTALEENPVLRELVTTPLMLNVILLAYRGKTVKDLPQLGSKKKQQHQVLEQYVKRMLEQPTRTWEYSPQQTKKWLISLAQQMQSHELSEFYLEYLQYSWLPTKLERVLSRCLGGLVFGLLFGLLFGLVIGLVDGLVSGLARGPVVGLFHGLQTGLFFGLQIWLVGGLLSGLPGVPRKKSKEPSPDAPNWSRNRFWLGLVQGLVVGLIAGLVVGFRTRLVVGLLFGLFFELVFGLFFGLLGGIGVMSEGSPSDVLEWSQERFWQGFVQGLVVGPVAGLVFMMLIGLIDGLITGLIGGLVAGLVVGLVCGLIVGLLFGLSSTSLNEPMRTKPNQGIYNSRRNAIRRGLFTGLLSGLIVGLLSGLVIGLLSGLVAGLFFGLFSGLVVGSNVGLSFGLLYGGRTYLSHYHLRYILWQRGLMPWHVVSFLNETTQRTLLKPVGVGGGYNFIHPLFQEYFASPKLNASRE